MLVQTQRTAMTATPFSLKFIRVCRRGRSIAIVASFWATTLPAAPPPGIPEQTTFPQGSPEATVVTRCQTPCVRNSGERPSPDNLNGRLIWQHCQNECVQAVKTSTLYPKYSVLSIMYSPPGCGDPKNPSIKCDGTSTVDYTSSHTVSTTVSIQSSFKEATDISSDVKMKGPDDVTVLGGSNSGFAVTNSSGHSETVSKAVGYSMSAKGNSNGINHDQDVFILLLNPAVTVVSAESAVEWNFGVAGPTQTIYWVTVADLKDPSKLKRENPNVAAALASKGLDDLDFKTILSLDPFVNGAANIDAKRFAPQITMAYRPANQASDCPSGTCSCFSFQKQLKSDDSVTESQSIPVEYTVGSSGGLTIGGITLKASDKWTWTLTTVRSNTTSDSDAVATSIRCPTPNYTGPTFLGIYLDRVFGSFMFALTPSVSNLQVLAAGRVINSRGTPVGGEIVRLSMAPSTRLRTVSDQDGRYFFYDETTPLSFAPEKQLLNKTRRTVQLTIEGKKSNLQRHSDSDTTIVIR